MVPFFPTKQWTPVAASSFFFCYNSSIAGASTVAMETNVQSQLWFCLGSPLGRGEVGTPFSLAFHSGSACLVLQRWKFPLFPVFNLSVISDMGQMAAPNHSEPFVLSCLNRLICYSIFAKLATRCSWSATERTGEKWAPHSFLSPLLSPTQCSFTDETEKFANCIWSLSS